MPVPQPTRAPVSLYPEITCSNIDATRTSAWLDTFEDISIPATVIDLDAIGERAAFLEWIESDSIFLPEGSENTASLRPVDTDSGAPVYRLPKLNEEIRAALAKYGGAVFPKLNWTSPRDAAFLLPQTASGPLHCTSPADVYLLLKSSDFVQHDLDPARAYEGAVDVADAIDKPLKLELVLKKFEQLNPANEFRCFVRDNTLIGITQRDVNFYDHLQPSEVQTKIRHTIRELWEDEVYENIAAGDSYVFDVYLNDKYDQARIIDFQPYRRTTDALLFTYNDLQQTLNAARAALESASNVPSPVSATDPTASSAVQGAQEETQGRLPVLRIIDSASHPEASRNAPQFGANMMPVELLEMSQGRSLDELAQAWESAVAAGFAEDDGESDDEE